MGRADLRRGLEVPGRKCRQAGRAACGPALLGRVSRSSARGTSACAYVEQTDARGRSGRNGRLLRAERALLGLEEFTVRAMKAPIVMTEPITLRNTAETTSASAARYWTANMITIGMDGMAVVSTALLPRFGCHSRAIANHPGLGPTLHDVFQEHQEQDVPIDFDCEGCKHDSGAEQGDAPGCVSQQGQRVDDELRNTDSARRDHESENGTQTIGSLTVSASLAASTEPQVAAMQMLLLLGGAFSLQFLPAVSSVRRRIVTGMTVRLTTRLAIAIGTAPGPPNR